MTFPRISARIGSITESATLAVDAKAKAPRPLGPVIGFGAVNRTSRPRITSFAAAIEACKGTQWHRYTPAGKFRPSKEAIAAKTLRDSGYEVAASQVLVTNGGKAGPLQRVRHTVGSRRRGAPACSLLDDVPRSIRLAGGVPVVVDTDESTGYLASVEQLEAARTPKDQDACVRVAVKPDGRGLPAGAGQGDRRMGA